MVLYEWRQIFKLTQTHSLNFSELENTFFGKVTLKHMKESSEFLGVFSFYPKLLTQKESEVAQLCPTLCDLVDCSPPGSSVHGILQARILKWVAISFFRGSSRLRDQTQVSHVAGRRFIL